MDYAARPHVDANNLGQSLIVGLGEYQGGELWVHDDEGDKEMTLCEDVRSSFGYKSGSKWQGHDVDIRKNWFEFDGNRLHFTRPFSGTRYTLIYFTCDRYAEASEDVRQRLDGLGFDFPWASLQLQATLQEKRAAMHALRKEREIARRERFGRCMARTW